MKTDDKSIDKKTPVGFRITPETLLRVEALWERARAAGFAVASLPATAHQLMLDGLELSERKAAEKNS